MDEDRKWMARALELAALGRGLTSPNPMVGAVVVRDGRLLGEGHHVRAGAPHAEVVALTQAGPAARGATLYVSLEPCNHRGRTPPCAAAIVGAGLARVVAAVGDPNPRAGGGADALRAAGVAVEMGCLAEEASALNRVFLTAMRERRPHVTLKCAMTLDGKTAAFDRSSRWITGEEARGEAHRLRSEADAIAVGIGTALADDPALTVRLGRLWPREPWRVVVDSHARLPVTAQVIRAGAPARALVAVTGQAPPDRVAALEARGATVLACKGEGGRVDLADLCSRLLGLDVLGLLVEGGGEIAAAFLEAHLVDRVAFFVAPLLIGGRSAPTPVEGAGRTVGAAVRLRSVRVRAVGEDWLIEGEVASRERRG
ncbi:MAG: riboflavin biosynthesis protein RibD [Candidatus Rokubacteria bacterium RIFCSPLOWO2_12_FULL_71_19]|nr:MAG: riboflavin biosynthesis protein RibD [Candidatus Rokubacteria bacterium RIFCSPLOWO2_12_FULL_71_19]